MKVLVIGATGYVGAPIVDGLVARGHQVVALSRSGKAARAEVEARTGDVTAPETLTAAAADVDAVVYAAVPTGDEAADTAAVDALIGGGRRFVYTSGIWSLGPTGRGPADEDSATNPPAISAYRPRLEQHILAASTEAAPTAVIRPAIVYGRGGGIPGMLVDWAAQRGTGCYIGDPGVRWPMVHTDDLADLYARVLETEHTGRMWHGVDEAAVSTVALAAAADIAAGGTGRAEPWALADAASALGQPFADALALDQCIVSAYAGELLGWRPQRSSVEELARGSYARS